uniref:Atg6 BARA domain-containing protein n=1 Tax=Biomphalaria glabrata TaxID=6526 RepID=A0A2C9LNF6_BIOGL
MTSISQKRGGSWENDDTIFICTLQLQVTGHLFDLMSGASEIDHPLCEVRKIFCLYYKTFNSSKSLAQTFETKIELWVQISNPMSEMNRTVVRVLFGFLIEYAALKDMVSILSDAPLGFQVTLISLNVFYPHVQLLDEERQLMQELELAERERKKIAEAMAIEKQKAKKLDEDEEIYWQEYNDQCRIASELEDEQRSVDNQLKYAQAQLDRLKKTNVFNATFHICPQYHKKRLDYTGLSNYGSRVEWIEINTAWGQVVLLLVSLANKIGLKFKKYRPVPYGNHSYIEVLDEKKELPLYGSGGIRFLWDTKFDSAMVAFLECLQQFRDEVEKEDSSFNLPYKMSKGKIYEGEKNQYSIKMQFNSEEQWTKALKYMLTNLKWALAWLSARKSLGD